MFIALNNGGAKQPTLNQPIIREGGISPQTCPHFRDVSKNKLVIGGNIDGMVRTSWDSCGIRTNYIPGNEVIQHSYHCPFVCIRRYRY
jgi:hypothetical protein